MFGKVKGAEVVGVVWLIHLGKVVDKHVPIHRTQKTAKGAPVKISIGLPDVDSTEDSGSDTISEDSEPVKRRKRKKRKLVDAEGAKKAGREAGQQAAKTYMLDNTPLQLPATPTTGTAVSLVDNVRAAMVREEFVTSMFDKLLENNKNQLAGLAELLKQVNPPTPTPPPANTAATNALTPNQLAAWNTAQLNKQ